MLLISSELEELIEGSDRVVVLKDGAVVGRAGGRRRDRGRPARRPGHRPGGRRRPGRPGRGRGGPDDEHHRRAARTAPDRDAPAAAGSRTYGVYAAFAVLVGGRTSPWTATSCRMSNLRIQLVPAVAHRCSSRSAWRWSSAPRASTCRSAPSIALAAARPAALPRLRPAPARSPIALLLGAVTGALSGAMVAFARVQPIVATLALMIGVRGLAAGQRRRRPSRSPTPTCSASAADTVAGVPLMAWIAAAAAVVVGRGGAPHHLRPPARRHRRQPAGRAGWPGCRCAGCWSPSTCSPACSPRWPGCCSSATAPRPTRPARA